MIRITENYEKLSVPSVPFITKDNTGEYRIYINGDNAKIRHISLRTGTMNCADMYDSIQEVIESFTGIGEVIVNAEIIIK